MDRRGLFRMGALAAGAIAALPLGGAKAASANQPASDDIAQHRVQVHLNGSRFTRADVEELISGINKALADGALLNR